MAERKAFPLRISSELYAEIEALAAAEFRSVNGQIEYMLRQAIFDRRRKVIEATEPDPRPTDRSNN
jgi:hypothetical protein